jgi:hypothetical protein
MNPESIKQETAAGVFKNAALVRATGVFQKHLDNHLQRLNDQIEWEEQFGEFHSASLPLLLAKLKAAVAEARGQLAVAPGKSEQDYALGISRLLVPFLHSDEWSDEIQSRTQLHTDLARLYKDLDYLSMAQKGGLALLNQRLQGLLERLQTASAESSRSAALELNDMLTRAIYLFPHLARSVAVEFKPNSESAQFFLERTAGQDVVRRASFLDWLMRNRTRVDEPNLALFPLPYVFEAGGQGAQTDRERRLAATASWPEVVFLPHRTITRRDLAGADLSGDSERLRVSLPPVLRLLTGYKASQRSLDHALYSLFLTTEIKGISFSDRSMFLPWQMEGPALAAGEKPNFVYHYLIFRDFGDIGCNRELARRAKIPQLAERSLFAPSYSSSLIDIAEDERGQWLERNCAYLALPSQAATRCQLLRFSDVPLRGTAQTLSAGQPNESALQLDLYRAVFEQGHPLRHCMRVFRGETVIEELTPIPVSRRVFGE